MRYKHQFYCIGFMEYSIYHHLRGEQNTTICPQETSPPPLWTSTYMPSIAYEIVISKLLKRYSKAKRTRAPAYSRALRRIKGGFPKGVKRSSGSISRVPGGDRVAVRVGVLYVRLSVNISVSLSACLFVCISIYLETVCF